MSTVLRNLRLSTWMGLATLSLVLTAMPANAQKPVKGQPPSPALPEVAYEVDVQYVEGLIQLYDVNDDGQCSIRVRVSEVTTPILTAESAAAAIVDQTGTVHYLDNSIDEDEPWDLISAIDINNAGQIVGMGVKDGVRSGRGYLLTPTATGYDLTDLGEGVLPLNLTESGDILLSSNGLDVVRLSNGTHISINQSNRWHNELNSQGLLRGEYSSSPHNQIDFISDLSGLEIPVEVIDDIGIGAKVYDLADSGYSVGAQYLPPKKVKGGYISQDYPATYDANGNATKVVFPAGWSFNATMKINEQQVAGQPLIAGYEYQDRNLWVRFPGFAVLRLTQLMDNAQSQAFYSLRLGDGLIGESNSDFRITTPRKTDGSTDHGGAPSFYGAAFYRESISNTGTVVGRFEGIYIVRPVQLP